MIYEPSCSKDFKLVKDRTYYILLQMLGKNSETFFAFSFLKCWEVHSQKNADADVTFI